MVRLRKYFTSNWPLILSLIFAILVIFPLFNTAYVYLKAAIENLSYPYAILAGLEDENLAKALMVLQGKSLYPPLTDYPFVVTLYPPVFFYLAALFVKFLGPTLYAGRLLSFISSLLVCLLCFLITWRLTKNFLWGLVAGLLFFTSGYIQWWGLMVKNDILAVFFGLAGILLFLRFEKTRKQLFSLPFLLLAVFTKQTAVAAPLAIMAYLFFQGKKRRRELKQFSLWFLGTSGLIFLFLTVVTRGQFFIDIILVPKSIAWNFSIFAQYWGGTFMNYGFLFFPAIAFLILERLLYRRTSLISWYFLSSVMARYDIGIVGSGNNYLMETIALAGILTVLFLHQLLSFPSSSKIVRKNEYWPILSVQALLVLVLLALSRQTPRLPQSSYGFLLLAFILYWFAFVLYPLVRRVEERKQRYTLNEKSLNRILGILLVLMFLFFLWQRFFGMAFPSFSLSGFYFSPQPPSNLSPYQEKIDQLIRDNPGRVLVDSESYLAIKNGRDFEYIPMALKLRQQAGYWNFKDSVFFRDIGKQKFRFFIKSQGWTDAEIMLKIFEHYELTKAIDTKAFFYEIYEPIKEDSEMMVNIGKMRAVLDELEKRFPTETLVVPLEVKPNIYLVGLTYANDNVYVETFGPMTTHPRFLALYRPLHSFHIDLSVKLKADSQQEIEEFIQEIFGSRGLSYRIFKAGFSK